MWRGLSCHDLPFQVPSILFAPSHLMAIMTLGINSALVMDCGYTETLVLPVSFSCYSGVFDPLFPSVRSGFIAGKLRQLMYSFIDFSHWFNAKRKTFSLGSKCYHLNLPPQVYECTPILPAWEALPLGGKAIHK